MELVPSSRFSPEELAGLFTRGYEGYALPFAVDVPQLEFMVRTFDLDLDASRVAVRDGEPVGLANLGVRDGVGWVGGVGVVASARRQGVGRLLMDALHEQARERGLREVWLEVLEQNEGAFRLYEELGYRVLRDVVIGSLDGELDAGAAREVDATEAHARIRELGAADEPWQRADDTLRHYDDLRGLVTDDGAAVWRAATGDRALLLQLAGTGAAARELLKTLRTYGVVTIFNVPEDDPAAHAFAALGGTVAVRQREMRLGL